jgi:hypothetical protein
MRSHYVRAPLKKVVRPLDSHLPQRMTAQTGHANGRSDHRHASENADE